jgi:ABC-type transport system substrate-binding protein
MKFNYQRASHHLLAASIATCLAVVLLCGAKAFAQSKAWPDAFPKKGADGVPESVDKLTIAVDSWGANDLNPWALTNVNFLGDYYNLRLMMQDPNGDLAAAWATEVNQTAEGLTFKLNPKATFVDGAPADAEAIKQNLEGFMGKYMQQAGYDAPLGCAVCIQTKKACGRRRIKPMAC